MARTHFSITAQRTISLLTGQVRERPMYPMRGVGVVQIGNQRVRVELPTTVQSEGPTPISDWNAAKQARRAHECAAALMGIMCGHA